MSLERIRVGIIGLGEVAQTIHLPTLQLLFQLYTTVSICDISEKTASHCASKFHVPHWTTDPHAVINNPSVDVIFNLTSDEWHAPYTIAALEAGKHVMVEKPMTLSLASAQQILEAEKNAKSGARVFVGYMRRYAPTFVQAFKDEIAAIPRILYARSRDIIGPNSFFVAQSGTDPIRHTDIPADATSERDRRINALLQEAWGAQEVTPEQANYSRFLGGLASHDLSLMREALGGLPESVEAVSVHPPFYTAMFTYRNKTADRDPFSVTYESGLDSVPRFDAHLAIYGEHKSVAIQYDTPYIKGLPIVVEIDELGEKGERVHRTVRSSFEDAYTAELRELWECVVRGKEIKTGAADAMEDLRLFDMMYRRYEEQGRR
ncbi:hypothetical protein MMC24_004064 [Lignoscripta atroalba]|nr:hypothetical protein [Lignoscripta atroalba]